MYESASVYKFTDAVEFLNFQFHSKRLKNSRFSLRAWARQLGYENPSFISHILKGERTLKMEVAEKFSTNLKLFSEEKKYFDILVLLKNSKTVDEKNIYIEILDSLRPKNQTLPLNLSLEAFRVVSDWYHLAILELVELSDFKNDTDWIKTRLGDQVSLQNINKAIKRLLKLKLLKSSNGKLLRQKDHRVLLENYIPSEAVRHFHRQMIEKAKLALEEQSIDERHLRGTLISLKLRDYKKIEALIKKAHDEVVKYSSKGDGDELYQLNTQFFRITKRKEDL